MAGQGTRATRTLVIFFLFTAVVFGLVALAGSWTPKLGLDLQGGTRITLIAKDENNSADNLEEARRIIDSRVNGSGVSEAEVTTQGNRFIVVEIPGESRRDLVETVKRQAQLRFRVVAQASSGAAAPPSSASPGSGPNGLPSEPVITVPPSPSPSASSSPSTKSSSTPRNRAPFLAGEEQAQGSPSPSLAPSNLRAATDSGSGSSSASPTDAASPSPAEGASTPSPEEPTGADDPLTWMNDPGQKSLAAFDAYTCPEPGEAPDVEDVPDKPLVTCDANGIKYLLSESLIEGSQLASADLLSPDGQNLEFGVSLAFNGEGSDEFGRISDALFGTQQQFAIVLDGEVISAPTMDARIHNGQAQITGDFTESEAQSLTTSLKFGALPLTVECVPGALTVYA